MSDYHKPVMLKECLDYLMIDANGTYIDCTLGGGGHSEAILNHLDGKGELFSIDQDFEAIEVSKKRLEKFNNFTAFFGNFYQMKMLCEKDNSSVAGILMDLGVSSHQIDADYRGFSFQEDGPLDMRMNQNVKSSAEDVVNDYSVEQLKKIFYEFGEERQASKIARAIEKKRNVSRITTTLQLKETIESCIHATKKHKTFARIFQAIRIEVNKELSVLEEALEEAFAILQHGGRLVVMSYHSLEDRIVKQFFQSKKAEYYDPSRPLDRELFDEYFTVLNRKPILASSEEQNENPRSRSAKLRVAEKVIRGEL